METSREVEFKPKNLSWGDGDIAVVPKYTIISSFLILMQIKGRTVLHVLKILLTLGE